MCEKPGWQWFSLSAATQRLSLQSVRWRSRDTPGDRFRRENEQKLMAGDFMSAGWRQEELGSFTFWRKQLERPRGHSLATQTLGGAGLKIIIAFIMAIIML